MLCTGRQLFAWTCNEEEMLRKMLDFGMDAVVTAYPEMALAAIEHRLGLCGQFEL
jgi:glycerophosphoryl diester phosphodiesterase